MEIKYKLGDVAKQLNLPVIGVIPNYEQNGGKK